VGLNSAIEIGRSAITASQAGIQVTSNNLANIATRGFARRSVSLQPSRGLREGSVFLGQGVNLADVRRQVSESVQRRLRASIGDESAAQESVNLRSSLEAVLNELSGQDLSTRLNDFFNVWSERANLTESSAVVTQEGEQLAGFVRQLHDRLTDLRAQIDGQIGSFVGRADRLAKQVADLNGQIVSGEVGGATANDLRDQRDQRINELSELLDVEAVEQPSGAVDLVVGSEPIVTGTRARALSVDRRIVDGSSEVSVRVGENQRALNVASGRIGAMLVERTDAIDATLDSLDTVTGQLIARVNQLHATGANASGLTSTRSQAALSAGDRALALNAPSNSSMEGLPGEVRNGGFLVRVTHAGTGSTEVVRVDVDLDGLDNNLQEGTGDDTSAEDIVQRLDAIEGVSASFGPDGRLSIDADAGFEFSFADDTSGVLGALGVNAYFTGSGARDVGVRQDLLDEPSRLQVGRFEDGELVENGTAMAIAALQDTPLDALGGESLRGAWQNRVQRVGSETEEAIERSEAATTVRENLEAQRSVVSGVSADEESVNLLSFQRQFQGAARVISVADELLQTLISIV